jgi:tether containing UBX domain for GLUT4
MSTVATHAAATSTVSETTPSLPISAQGSEQPRNVQIFSAPTSSTPQAARNAFIESDYLPTIEHAKVHQAQLLNKTRNTRLLSDKELEDQEKAQQEKIEAAAAKGGALRIRFPDGTLVQMNFTKDDTASVLYDFAQGFLDRKNEPFELKYTSPTGRLVLIQKDGKRLSHDLRFSTNELITFQWAEGASPEARASRKTLAQEWQAKATELKVEELVPEKPQPSSSQGQTVAEGKRKVAMSSEDKESKLKNMLGKTLFKRK